LFLSYFSQTPYRLGLESPSEPDSWQAAKFCVKPEQHPSWLQRLRFMLTMGLWVPLAMTGRVHRHENFLRTVLNRYLAERDATFTFYVQLRRPRPLDDVHRQRGRARVAMPLDDATRRWPERLSCYAKVATLTIHREPRYADAQFAQERMALGERLTFSPWHSLDDHRPLGSINRARRFVYARVSQMRHRLNGTDASVPEDPAARAVEPLPAPVASSIQADPPSTVGV
jgi:hypothetical protein